MQTNSEKAFHNQSIECCKLLAAFFIVLIHIHLPGSTGLLMNALGRFSVPMFFAISGYFSFSISGKKIAKRLIHIIYLTFIAIAMCLFWNFLKSILQGNSIIHSLKPRYLSLHELSDWVFLHINPFYGHLWYLTAVAVCYCVLWVYVTFYGKEKVNYLPLYLMSAMLFAIRYSCAELMQFGGGNLPYYFFRDGWFFGLPMFSMGLFLHEHQDRIIQNFHLTTLRQLLLLIAGSLLSILPWKAYGYISELPLGAVVQTFALLLLTTGHPCILGTSRFSTQVTQLLGYLSTAIYLLHLLVDEAYVLFFQSKVTSLLNTHIELWLHPFLVILFSILLAFAFRLVSSLFKRI